MGKKLIRCGCCDTQMCKLGMYLKYEHFRCNDCGHEKFFLDGHSTCVDDYECDPDYKSDLDVAYNYKDLLQWNHRQALKHLNKISRNKYLRILDVGCFNGFFVKELRQMGHEAFGVDFNHRALDFGISKYDLEVNWISDKSLNQLQSENEKYDVITMFEVIEHLDDFLSVLREVLELLNSQGFIVISTPNSRMFWRPLLDYPPHHLARFTPDSIKKLVEHLGLKVVIHEEQMSLYDMFRNYLGSQFRSDSSLSMRGGEFRNKKMVNLFRKWANKYKWTLYLLLSPIDSLLKMLGIRYISQIIIAQK